MSEPTASNMPPGAASRRLSLWAAASLVCSLALCPPVCFLGPVLGVAGVVQTRNRAEYRGRRLAIAGIIIGVVVIAGWLGGFAWWNMNIRRPMLDGPRMALDAGFDGELDAFRQAFHGEAGEASDAEVLEFLGTMSRRYGRLLDITQNTENAEPIAAGDVNRQAPVIPYTFTFENRSVSATALFILSDRPGLPQVRKWGWIAIHDPELGNFSYPVAVEVGNGLLHQTQDGS